MAIFYNQASLSLGGNVTNSNITSGEVVGALTMTKTAASSDYGAGDSITYIVSIVNDGIADSAELTLTDNLGAFTVPGEAGTAIPLTYIDGSVIYYRNGELQPAPTVTATDSLVISGITVPAGGNVTLVYEGRANAFAPIATGSAITNTAALTGCEELTATATVPVREEPVLTIAKSISPAVVTCSGEVTYTFVVQNTGNAQVVATDNLIVSDIFNPQLSDITVTLNGAELAEGTGYTYDEATGAFATVPGAVPVPAATYTRDAVTGAVTTTPGFAVITVTGTI